MVGLQLILQQGRIVLVSPEEGIIGLSSVDERDITGFSSTLEKGIIGLNLIHECDKIGLGSIR
jgi:hypothetical protein